MSLQKTIDSRRSERVGKKHPGVSLVRVETRSTLIMYRIDRGRAQLGFVEKYPDDRETTHPWKGYRGLGVGTQFVGAYYVQDGGLDRAVAEVLK